MKVAPVSRLLQTGSKLEINNKSRCACEKFHCKSFENSSALAFTKTANIYI